MAEVNKDTQNTNNYITKDDLVEFAIIVLVNGFY